MPFVSSISLPKMIADHYSLIIPEEIQIRSQMPLANELRNIFAEEIGLLDIIP